MSWFNRKRRTQMNGTPPGMTFRNPFEAVPLASPGVEVLRGKDDVKEGFVLRRALDIGDNWRARTLRKLRLDRAAHIKLDQAGSVYWRQIDGQRDLEQIAEGLAMEFKLSPEEARKSTLVFTKDLMIRQFIQLKISTPEQEAANATSKENKGKQ